MLVGADYGSEQRKRIPASQLSAAYDLATIWNADGVVRYSPIFYGYYGSEATIGRGYRLPLAYLITTLVSIAYSFIVVLKKMASNSRQSRMANKDEEFTFSWKLFTDWDYMVGHSETATTKHASIVTTMKEAIVEEQEKKQEERKHLLLFLRILANVILVILLAASTYVIYLFVERSRKLELIKLRNPDYQASFWAENELTIVMTLISTVFPAVLDVISLIEKFHPRTALRLMLGRIFVFNLINLYTMFIALYNKQKDLKYQASLSGITTSPNTLSTTFLSATCTNCTSSDSGSSGGGGTADLIGSVSTGVPVSPATSVFTSGTSTDICNSDSLAATMCWETMIGQEVFKLTVMDTVTLVGQILVVDVFRAVFIKYCNNICCWDLEMKFPEYADFKTSENVLHLISNQGIIWLGLLFCPGLALLNLLKLLLLMYVRYWTVMVCNVPEERIFRASRSNNFYFALLLVMLFLCILPPLFAIVAITPSECCGPFSNLTRMYDILTVTMEKELPNSVNRIIHYMASPGVILPTFMLMAMTIYYLIAVGRSLRDANNELRSMLEYERGEGKKKVYAMADAKHDTDQLGGMNNPKAAKMANTVASVLKATQMAKVFSGLPTDKRKHTSATSGGKVGYKVAPAVGPKPHVPVAVVHGKRSLKRTAAAVKNRAVALRQQPREQQRPHQQQKQQQQWQQKQQQQQKQQRQLRQQKQQQRQQQQKQLQQRQQPLVPRSRQTLTGTNGHMLVMHTSSLDTPDDSSNDEGEVYNSYSSSRPLHESLHQHDDPSSIVDDTGHLRLITEDDVFLEMDQDNEEDEELDEEEDEEEEEHASDDAEDPEDAEDLSPLSIAPAPERSSRPPPPRAGKPPPPAAVRRRANKPSRKIQPTEIPKITVVDFEKEEVMTEGRSHDVPETHVEPMVIIENEQKGNKHKPGKKKTIGVKEQDGEGTNPGLKKKTNANQQSRTRGANGQGTQNDPVSAQEKDTEDKVIDGNDEECQDPQSQSSNSDKKEGGGSSTDRGKKTLGKAISKAKFSSILSRFQKMGENG